MSISADDLTKLRPGTCVKCEVVGPEPGGYRVTLLPNQIRGFMPSQDELEEGQVILATLVCLSDQRALLGFAHMIGLEDSVQYGSATDQEKAFSIWADSHPKKYKARRAIDLIMPSPDGVSNTFKGKDVTFEQLIDEIEGSQLTGCVKAISEPQLSRSATLLLGGRAAGTIYTSKANAMESPEAPLNQMLRSLSLPDTDIEVYELPPDIVLSMSSLFFGCPADKPEEMDAKLFFEHLVKFSKKQHNASCLVANFPKSNRLTLAYVIDGEVFGSYNVDERKFEEGSAAMQAAILEEPPHMEASILPPEMTSDSVVFGHSLRSVARKLK